MARMEIITGPERRRSWSEEQKQTIVDAAFAPGAIVAEVARRVAVCAGQIYRWRQELGHAGSGFAPVVIATMDTASHPGVFNNAPVAVLLAILPANFRAQEHDVRQSSVRRRP